VSTAVLLVGNKHPTVFWPLLSAIMQEFYFLVFEWSLIHL